MRSLQARLRQIGWFTGDVSDVYGTKTTASVRGFQAKRGLDATGMVDETTWNRVLGMTRRPTSDELGNVKPKPVPKPAALKPTTPAKPASPVPAKPTPAKPAGMSWDQDARCMTGRVMCVSKSTSVLTWVIDGQPQYQFTVRFGSADLPTREGVFPVYRKAREIRSNIDQSLMPFSMFFSGGEAVHYSPNFARVGYNGNSHGCVNVRDWNGIARLYAAVNLGDKVVVHW
ncbi:MAG: L,D-transpeptidase family protein [Terracoccus sp.]